MLPTKALIVYVCSNIPEFEANAVSLKLMKELDINIEPADSIQEIFPRLSDPKCKIDFIAIGVDDLYNTKGADAFDVLKTLSTLIHCTVHRKKEGERPVKRQTKIVAAVRRDTDPKLVKELILMPEIDYFVLQYGHGTSYEEMKATVRNYVDDTGERVPKSIVDLIRNKTEPKRSSGSIELTCRQQQIFDIITTKGASNKHIAKMLSISESTVKLHIGAIFKKYGVKNRTQLAVFSKINY